MLLPKALKMRAIKDTKDTIALVANTGGTKCASAQMSWHLGLLTDPALLNRQTMSTDPNMVFA